MGNGVGQRIKEYRLTHGLTLAELSKRTGIPAPTLNRYELGQRKPTSEILAQISVALGLPLAYLMGLDDNLKASLAESIPKDDIIAKIPGAFPLNPTHKIPLLGQISAGLPLYAEENVEGYLWTDLNHGAEYFGLRVKGDSMNAANIKDGDIIIVRKQDIVDDNDIAVVLVDNENATVKRYHRTGDIVILTPQSTNPLHHLQQYDLKNHSVRILGRVMECRSKY